MTPLRLTNSEAKTFRRCKRKWYLGIYRELTLRKVEFDRPLSIGNRVHDALAAYYVPGTQRGDPLEFLRVSVAADLEKYPEYEAKIKHEADLCDAMLTGYMEWLAETGADAEIEVVEPEGAVEVPLDKNTPDVTLLSKIDARINDLSDGKRLALEHKTVGSLTDVLPTLQLDTQFLTEHLVEFMKDGVQEEPRTKGVLWNGLRKVKRTARAKPPFYGRERILHNRAELRAHWYHVRAIANEIQFAREKLDRGYEHHTICPPNPTKDCSWDCEFFQVCVMFDDGSDPEPAINDLYVTRDPLERYAEQARIELPEPPA